MAFRFPPQHPFGSILSGPECSDNKITLQTTLSFHSNTFGEAIERQVLLSSGVLFNLETCRSHCQPQGLPIPNDSWGRILSIVMSQHYKLHFKHVPILTEIQLVHNNVDQKNVPLIQRPVEAIVNHEPADPNDSWARKFSIATRQHYKLHFEYIPILSKIWFLYNSIDHNNVTLNTETTVCFVCCRQGLRANYINEDTYHKFVHGTTPTRYPNVLVSPPMPRKQPIRDEMHVHPINLRNTGWLFAKLEIDRREHRPASLLNQG